MPTVTRADLVAEAMKFNGRDNGHGYDCANPFSADLGHPKEAWCADFVSDIAKRAGAPMVAMQSGCHTGFAGCPEGWEYAHNHKGTRPSWEAQPFDPIIFHWLGGDPDGDHVEATVWWRDGVLRTIGGNSGPSNVDGFKGTGGVHLHDWSCPKGVGNSAMLGAINLEKFAPNLGRDPVVLKAAKAQPKGHRTLMLKSPRLRGADVTELQQHLNSDLRLHSLLEVPVTGVYDKATQRAVVKIQEIFQDAAGVAGVHTLKYLHLPH